MLYEVITIGAVINKFPPEGPNAYQGNDFPVVRYADVLLMLAEAINENSNGPTQEAIDLVDLVRERANIADLSGSDTGSKQAFNDAILRERVITSYSIHYTKLYEHGHARAKPG